MRTTVTLDADTEQLVRRRMKERKVSFKQALNDAIREGAVQRTDAAAAFAFPTHALGRPSVDLDKALRLAGELDDEESVRRMGAGS